MMDAALVFSPNGPGQSLFNSLHAADPAFAFKGIRRAAWDATCPRALQRHVNAPPEPDKRYLFAVADRILVKVVRMTFGQTGKGRTAASLAEGWRKDAGNGARMIILDFKTATQMPKDQRPEMSADRLLKHPSAFKQGVRRSASV